jgi:hypothetical protein
MSTASIDISREGTRERGRYVARMAGVAGESELTYRQIAPGVISAQRGLPRPSALLVRGAAVRPPPRMGRRAQRVIAAGARVTRDPPSTGFRMLAAIGAPGPDRCPIATPSLRSSASAAAAVARDPAGGTIASWIGQPDLASRHG